MAKISNNVLALLSVLVIVMSLFSTLLVVDRALTIAKIGREGGLKPPQAPAPQDESSIWTTSGRVGVVVASFKGTESENP